MKALFYFAPLFRQHTWAFTLALLLAVITLAAGTALLGVSGWFLTATSLTTIGVSFNLFAPSAMVRGLSFIRIVSRYFEKYVGHNATLKLLSNLRSWLFERLFPRLPLDTRNQRFSDVVSRLTSDVDSLDTIFLLAIGPVTSAIILGVLVTIITTLLLPVAGLFYALGFFISILIVPVLLVMSSKKLGANIVNTAAKLRSQTLDALAGHDDIILFSKQKSISDAFNGTAKSLSKLRQTQANYTALATALVQVLTGLALLAIIISGITAFQNNTLSGPVLAGLVFAALGSFEATTNLVRSIGKFGQALASAQNLYATVHTPITIQNPETPASLPADFSIEFSKVNFNYNNENKILENFSFQIPQHSKLAICGESGSGKSTILMLLLRLVEPQSGTITLGGTNIATLSQSDLHASIALLSQDSPVFFDTLRNNLLIANTTASDDELWSALKRAKLAPLFENTNTGLETMIGETGTTLSAGQSRRLCLARTLLSKAPIIALDEPTAGLDRDTELEILTDVPTIFADRTVILVTHAQLPISGIYTEYTLNNGFISNG